MNLTKDRKTTGIKIAPNNPMRIKEIFFTLWKYKNTPFVKKIKNKKNPAIEISIIIQTPSRI
ncbi:hypothetical protein [Lysinibacillus sp. fls2-241-R2A-57]|uniref:hypothetical protein n=1 Tax=Lysinibacillus sp. fls2-241-R2A-57 TaxID=3040292 RepID=UPI002554E35A|nr:hypothetical protein [Lysinibacillus sp. fls2-241-R2A-57]